MDSSGDMVEYIEETSRTLNINNQGIVKYLCGIQEERNNLENIINKQFEEREHTESEIEKLTFKLYLINKSLTMRIKTKNNYDKTIEEIKANYSQLVDRSNKLMQIVEKTQTDLENLMNKKIGTGAQSGDDEIKILYVKSLAKGDEPTKEERPRNAATKWNSRVREVRKSHENSNATNNKDLTQANGERMNNGMKTTHIKTEHFLQIESDTKSESINDNNNNNNKKPMTALKIPSYNITSGEVSGSIDTSCSGSIKAEDSHVYPEIKSVCTKISTKKLSLSKEN